MQRSFLETDVNQVVKQLTLGEKISLLAGPDWWNTTKVPRLNVPSVRMSDGPNGIRGSSHFIATPAQCLPCETSMAATFDLDLIYKVGAFLAAEAKLKSSTIILAPTCNIQRNPLGGRAFESFSEDPYLSGIFAASYINGLQQNGVAATIKHFVGNDQEHERTAADSVVSDRALREIYLYPFMLAQKLAQPWAFMPSYGRINNIHCSENPRLLQGILREEWGFKGIVISDWNGTYGVDQPINAGLDLEMPGPSRWRTPVLINHVLSAQKLLPSTLDDRATTVLNFVQKLAKRNPDVVYGDGKERTAPESDETKAFCRKLAADGMVLLKNDRNVLPLKPETAKKVLIVGPNAKSAIISGGGSAQLKPSYAITPFDGIAQNAPSGIDISYSLGCYAHKYLPGLEASLKAPSGEPGWSCTFHTEMEAEAKAAYVVNDSRIKLNDHLPPGLGDEWIVKAQGTLTLPSTEGVFEFGLAVAGRAKLFVNGQLVIDNWTSQRAGDFFYGQGTVEERATIPIDGKQEVDVLVVYTNTKPPGDDGVQSQPSLMRGVRLGGCLQVDPEKAIADAAQLASKADVVVYVGGLTPEWEAEGFDRPTLSMPGRQDETISALATANPNTVVVLQTGSALSMPWLSSVPSVIQAWYSGNELGNALADVLYGAVNPGGRLPLTIPKRVEDIPAYPMLESENGKIIYTEDVFVGYKWYQKRNVAPLFPFGFGLSYTTFKLSELTVRKLETDVDVEVTVTVTNTGLVSGSQTVQVYVSYPLIDLSVPLYQLRGFAKVRDLPPGKSQQAKVKLDRGAFSVWDIRKDGWKVNEGVYGVHIGTSSEDLVAKESVQVERTFHWYGI